MKSILERFETKYEPIPWTGCWIWTGAISRDGVHPQTAFQIGNKRHIASRVAYKLYTGDIPEGQIVRHTCDNSLCVNPAHLILGTQQDNMNDRIERGRWKGGRTIINDPSDPQRMKQNAAMRRLRAKWKAERE